MYYLNSRYYDPEIGRFINADDISIINDTSDEFNGLNLYLYCFNNPVNTFDDDGRLAWWKKILIGVAFVIFGAAITALTMGTGTGFFAAFTSALLTSMAQVGISTAISAGIGMIIGGLTTGTWEGAFKGLIDGTINGFMWGCIFTGGAQILSSVFKGVAKIADSHNMLDTLKNSRIFSPDKLRNASSIADIARKGQPFYDYGGTLIRFTKHFHIDVSSKSFLHLAFKAFGVRIRHFPLGTILAGIFGGFSEAG